MRCRHCHGLMVVDHFLHRDDNSGHLWLRTWRCARQRSDRNCSSRYPQCGHLSWHRCIHAVMQQKG